MGAASTSPIRPARRARARSAPRSARSRLAPAAIETSEEALRLLYETYGSVPFVRAVDATGQLALLGIVSNNDTAALGVLFRCSRSDLARAAPIDAAKAHGSNGCLALILAAYIRLVYAAPRAAPLMGLISRSFVSIEAGLLEPRVPNALCAEAENDDDCREVGREAATTSTSGTGARVRSDVHRSRALAPRRGASARRRERPIRGPLLRRARACTA